MPALVGAAWGGLLVLSTQRVVGVGTLARATSARSVTRGSTGRLGRWRRLLGLAGYSRREDDDPLEQSTRETIYDRIQADPGIYLSALSDEVDVPLGTVRYHLKILEFEDLVTPVTVDGRRRYYPADVEPTVLETLHEDSAVRDVLLELADGAATVGELANRADLAPSTVTHHTTRLAELGLVEREADGRTTYNRLTDAGREALRAARGGDGDSDGDEALAPSA